MPRSAPSPLPMATSYETYRRKVRSTKSRTIHVWRCNEGIDAEISTHHHLRRDDKGSTDGTLSLRWREKNLQTDQREKDGSKILQVQRQAHTTRLSHPLPTRRHPRANCTGERSSGQHDSTAHFDRGASHRHVVLRL